MQLSTKMGQTLCELCDEREMNAGLQQNQQQWQQKVAALERRVTDKDQVGGQADTATASHSEGGQANTATASGSQEVGGQAATATASHSQEVGGQAATATASHPELRRCLFSRPSSAGAAHSTALTTRSIVT